jgi:hypothetical protein
MGQNQGERESREREREVNAGRPARVLAVVFSLRPFPLHMPR